MSAIFPDQETDPLWFNTELSPPPLGGGGNVTTGGDDALDYPSARSIVYSILCYAAVMLIVLLPLMPCCRGCSEDDTNSERYIEKRKAEIKADLVTKKVQEHNVDHLCPESEDEEFEIGELDDVNAKVQEEAEGGESATVATDEESVGALSHCSSGSSNRQNICSICLEPFAVGEEVSWSRNHDCNHVYHQGCISQWLMKHDECPVCRCDYLYEDWRPTPERTAFCRRQRASKCTCGDLKEGGQDKRSKCVFCIAHGLEERPEEECKEPESCELPRIEEDGSNCEREIDLEMGRKEEHTPPRVVIKAEESPCPVHGDRRDRNSRRRERHRREQEDSPLSSYNAQMRDTWWALSQHHIGSRYDWYPSWSARSQFD